VEKAVRPKKLAPATAKVGFAVIVRQLQEKEVVLRELQKQCKQLAGGTEKELHSAQTPIDALSAEKGHWEAEPEILNDSILKTVGNATIGAALNSYCGMFNHGLRYSFVKDKWPGILGINAIPSHLDLDSIFPLVNEATLN
jgi:hypothetical protein